MVTEPGANTDIQVARFSTLQNFAFHNWMGSSIEIGARGGVVQLWAIHSYFGQHNANPQLHQIYVSALSSNPDHEGELALGLDDLFGSPAIYGTRVHVHRSDFVTSGGYRWHDETEIIPLYGIIRPRRQVWVEYAVNHHGSNRNGIEIYYSEIDATRKQEAQVNYKYGKYRRGR